MPDPGRASDAGPLGLLVAVLSPVLGSLYRYFSVTYMPVGLTAAEAVFTDLVFALAFTYLFVKVGAALGGGRMAGVKCYDVCFDPRMRDESALHERINGLAVNLQQPFRSAYTLLLAFSPLHSSHHLRETYATAAACAIC